MTTTVISLKGHISEYGPRLERAPDGLVYVGRRWTMGGWDLPAHPLRNPFTLRRCGTPEAAVAAYIRHLINRPDLDDQADALRGHTLACHANVIAWYADGLTRDQLAERADDLDRAAGAAEDTLFDRLEGVR